jgi:hypothetical protein
MRKTGGKAPRLPLSALETDEIDSNAPSPLPPQHKAQSPHTSEVCTNCAATGRSGPCRLSLPGSYSDRRYLVSSVSVMTGVRVSAEARLRLSFTATRRLCLLCDRNVNCNYRTSELKNAWSFTSTFPHVIRIAARPIN